VPPGSPIVHAEPTCSWPITRFILHKLARLRHKDTPASSGTRLRDEPVPALRSTRDIKVRCVTVPTPNTVCECRELPTGRHRPGAAGRAGHANACSMRCGSLVWHIASPRSHHAGAVHYYKNLPTGRVDVAWSRSDAPLALGDPVRRVVESGGITRIKFIACSPRRRVVPAAKLTRCADFPRRVGLKSERQGNIVPVWATPGPAIRDARLFHSLFGLAMRNCFLCSPRPRVRLEPKDVFRRRQ